MRASTEYRAEKPRLRPQTMLVMGICGPSMAFVGQKGASESHHRKDVFVQARAWGTLLRLN